MNAHAKPSIGFLLPLFLHDIFKACENLDSFVFNLKKNLHFLMLFYLQLTVFCELSEMKDIFTEEEKTRES